MLYVSKTPNICQNSPSASFGRLGWTLAPSENFWALIYPLRRRHRSACHSHLVAAHLPTDACFWLLSRPYKAVGVS